jgi:hypothetical protein
MGNQPQNSIDSPFHPAINRRRGSILMICIRKFSKFSKERAKHLGEPNTVESPSSIIQYSALYFSLLVHRAFPSNITGGLRVFYNFKLVLKHWHSVLMSNLAIWAGVNLCILHVDPGCDAKSFLPFITFWVNFLLEIELPPTFG